MMMLTVAKSRFILVPWQYPHRHAFRSVVGSKVGFSSLDKQQQQQQRHIGLFQNKHGGSLTQAGGGGGLVVSSSSTTASFAGISSNNSSSHSSITKRNITIPTVIESGALGERAFDLYSRLLRERIICVHGPITDDLSSLVTAQLLFLEAEKPKQPLYMYINCPGGSTTATMAIYDTMQYIQPEVHTICMGQASSLGSLLLTGGEETKRYSLPNSTIMLHQPYGGIQQGMASDIHIHAQEMLHTRSVLQTLYSKHTNRTIQEIEQVMDRNTYFDVDEAIEFGIIDSILDKRNLPSNNTDTNSDDTINEEEK